MIRDLERNIVVGQLGRRLAHRLVHACRTGGALLLARRRRPRPRRAAPHGRPGLRWCSACCRPCRPTDASAACPRRRSACPWSGTPRATRRSCPRGRRGAIRSSPGAGPPLSFQTSVVAMLRVATGRAAGRVAELRVASEIAHEDDFIYASHARSPFKSSAILNSAFSGVKLRCENGCAQKLPMHRRFEYAFLRI